ncbi:hypothetical protein BJI69_17335 [Luteibacter rhizovicinus DSM 16549]|uniref:DUF1211 domain-containing membrane protein n=1 Tax=Luteibacter rhizovicinus DSM 16549 TaxID=1440763 RepID=A0A1L3EWT5_9GAMM|nr:TMEM175 family protein [Luteibacter rhizovicinus]APG05492.1 hypothetical protein BJI69_17335 [Luteibacter rhizovicinus DSM 16549]
MDTESLRQADERVRLRHLDRLVMMSDGVFAIALTLSAVELHPEMEAGKTLFQVWAMPLAVYFMSFLLIAAVWVAHRRNLAHLHSVDTPTTWLNLLLLSMIGLLPVVVRFFLVNIDDASRAGMVAYAIVLSATYFALALTWGYPALVANHTPSVSRRRAWAWLAEYVFVALLFAALALYAVGMMWIVWPVGIAAVLLRITSLRLGRAA